MAIQLQTPNQATPQPQTGRVGTTQGAQMPQSPLQRPAQPPTVPVPAVTPVPAGNPTGATTAMPPTPGLVGAPAAPVPMPAPVAQPLPSTAAPLTTAQYGAGGVAARPSTPGVFGQLYQAAPGGTATYTSQTTGKPVTGTTQAYTMPDGTQITGIPQPDGTFVDQYGQVINPTTGLNESGAEPYEQAVGMAVPGAAGGAVPYMGGSTNAGAGGSSLASILGPSAVLQQGANQAASLEQTIDPGSYAASLDPLTGNPQAWVGGFRRWWSAPPPAAPPAAAPSTLAALLQPPVGPSASGANPTASALYAPPPSGSAAPSSAPGPTTNSTLNGLLAAVPTGSGTTNTATTPGSTLLDQTLGAPSLSDPVQQALAGWQTFRNASAPQYQADLRSAMDQAAAGGALGSGMLNTSLGNIANQYQYQLQTAQQSLLENALQQQNQNAYTNVGIAQQQQGFQNQQQQEAVTNALNEYMAGNQNNPANTSLLLSSIFGNQAAAAGQGLSSLITGTQNAQAGAASNATLQGLLQQLMGLGGGAAGTVPAWNPTPSVPAWNPPVGYQPSAPSLGG